jgi:putative Mn2+ efflux pump MntP
MNFIFAVILLLLGAMFMIAGLAKAKTESDTSFDTPGRIMSFIVGIFLVLVAIGIYHPSVN